MRKNWDSKKECRAFFKSLCTKEFTQGLVQNQQQLNAFLLIFLNSQKGIWGGYRALSEEAQVDEANKCTHLLWVFPRMQKDCLEFFVPHNFVVGPYGVLEPDGQSTKKELQDLQGVLMPGLAFNKNGIRLGKGKGFYDKTLSKYQGLKVGVCFDFQITPAHLPSEDHDVRVDYIITESGVVECKKHRE